MNNLFTKHPKIYGETYLEHFKFACYCGVRMTLSGIACMIHGFLPFIFTYTGSNTIFSLSKKFLIKRNNKWLKS